MQKFGNYHLFPHLLTDANDLRIYGILQSLNRFCDKEVLVSINQIYYYLKGKPNPSSNMKKSIVASLESLSIKGLLTKCGSEYVFDPQTIGKITPFESCSQEVFNQLIDRPELLLHYINIEAGRIHNWEVNGKSRVICKKSLERFAAEEGVSRDSIIRYNAALENLHLIYVGHGKFNGDSSDCNVYSLYEDRKYVDSYIGSFANKDCKAADEDRSVSQRYNRYIKDPTKYSSVQVKELYQAVSSYNDRMRERGKVQPDYLKKIKDLSSIIVD